MNKILFYICLACSIIVSLNSCQKAPYIMINGPKGFSYEGKGGSQTLIFTSNRDWTISSSESWVIAYPSSGKASNQDILITITCYANGTYDPRSCVITIMNGDISETVTISQDSNSGLIAYPTLFEIDDVAQTISLDVQSNVDYTVSIDTSGKEWISQSLTKGLSTDKLFFMIKENPAHAERKATITLKQLNGSLEQIITVFQDSKDGVKVVDMGLSVKWASANIGAKKPEEIGYYFAWGETSPKEVYSWWNYKWCDDSMKLTKYNVFPTLGIVDNKTVLELEDDAARVNWGENWRVPTQAEWEELCAYYNCTWSWIDKDGITGCEVVSIKNGNKIFLPTAGRFIGVNLNTSSTMYWSANIDTRAELINSVISTFGKTSHHSKGLESRYYGLPIRPVTY